MIDNFSGLTYETPEAEFSYNVASGAKNDSTCTIDLRIQGPTCGEIVTSSDISNVKTIAYNYLKDNDLLSINATTSGCFAIMKLKKIKVKPIAGTDVWEATCQYSPNDYSGSTDVIDIRPEFTFSTTAKQTHITHSRGTLNRFSFFYHHLLTAYNNVIANAKFMYDWQEITLAQKMAIESEAASKYDASLKIFNKYSAKYGATIDYMGAIGVSEGEIQGVDIYTPTMTFSRQVNIMDDVFTWQVIRNLATATGSVNADYFFEFQPGEILFKGVTNCTKATVTTDSVVITGGDNGETPITSIVVEPALMWTLTLDFEGNPNATLDMGKGMEPVFKRGWDYLWVEYQKETATDSNDNKKIMKYPVQGNIEVVYPYLNFCDFFGFGDGREYDVTTVYGQ